VFVFLYDETTAIVPNSDLSRYYLVHTTNRFPTPEIGEDGLRDRFAREGSQFGFARSSIGGAIQQQLLSPADMAWEKGVWVRYGIDPDSEPEE
ncbi:MAG: hypothetical protein KDA89_02925, partial [Planctomycetaceae bacterium]|nr:hypothetical protein [Planctomycetaceae bacterium]